MGIFFRDVLSNTPLMSALCAWLISQVLKIFLFTVIYREWDTRRITGAGGMPSSHSALVAAFCTSIGISDGVASDLFAVSFVIAAIVMYDAAGIRRAVGKQAKILNYILSFSETSDSHPASANKLQEFQGHTPWEVFAGACLGIAVAFAFYFLH